MKTIYGVEIKGYKDIKIFSNEIDAIDYATIQSVFNGKKVNIISKDINENKYNEIFNISN